MLVANRPARDPGRRRLPGTHRHADDEVGRACTTGWPGRPWADLSDYDRAARDYGILAGQGALPPETIADAAVWLASDAALGVTGQAVVVDSGHLTMPGFNPVPAGP